MYLLVHVDYAFGSAQEVAVTVADQGAQLVAVLIDIGAKLLLEPAHNRDRILECIFPRFELPRIGGLIRGHPFEVVVCNERDAKEGSGCCPEGAVRDAEISPSVSIIKVDKIDTYLHPTARSYEQTQNHKAIDKNIG
jgi:hypothetical protein